VARGPEGLGAPKGSHDSRDQGTPGPLDRASVRDQDTYILARGPHPRCYATATL